MAHRVAMVVFSYYPADSRVRREAEALDRSGIDVDIICVRDNTEQKMGRIGQITVYRIMKNTTNQESILRYFSMTMIFSILAFIKLIKLSLKNKYDAIQAHNMPDFLVFVGIVHKIFGIPIILDLHDLSVELFSSKWTERKTKILKPIVRFSEKISCLFADELITTSLGFKKMLIERRNKPEKITLVMNTADENIFKLTVKRQYRELKSNIKLIYHGRVAKRFGLHIAIEAVNKLQDKIKNPKLHIYGKYDPSYRFELETMISKLGLEDRVFLKDPLRREDIVEIIKDADIGLVPYLSDTFMNLALSTKTFEYIRMALPVVASRLPSIASLFDDKCIFYFEPANVTDLVNKIFEICKNPSLREEKAGYALKSYEKFSWSIMESRYLSLINRAITGISK